jgi:SPP1 gp7 family putative phage head morphogenesis protein
METFSTILDWMVLHQVRLMQLSVLYQAQAQEELDKTEPELGRIAAEIAALVTSVGGLRRDDTRALTAFDSLKRQALAIRLDGHTRVQTRLARSLDQIKSYERLFFSAVLRAGGRRVVTPPVVADEPEVMGHDMTAWHQRLLANDVHRIQVGLALGARLGEDEGALRARLLGQARYGGRGGVTAVARNELDTLARTAIGTFADFARVQINVRNPLVGQEVYVAVLDTRTTKRCRALHGTVYSHNKGPRPPIHWYCRSIRVPLVGKGSNRIPSYHGWLSRLSAREQNEVLGPRQGEAFRAGALSPQNFSEPNWRGIDLKTVAKRESPVFKAAGMDVPFQ